jgi:tRNA nucleotidyltransferase (CCA-adding enzyme)
MQPKPPMDTSLLALLTPDQRIVLDQVRAAARALGVRACLVGGAVRDWLLTQPIGDLDFSVEGDAIAVARAAQARFGGDVLAHEKFRTATWSTRQQAVDIAMARAERYERPAALPAVTPARIADDLGRRDFTINAMALDLDDGALLDPYGGRADLDRRSIRALHDRSFVDDPTRMLRAARYAARLGFAVEPDTRAWIDLGLPRLNDLSGERIKYDLELIFLETAPETAPETALGLLTGWGAFRALGIAAPSGELLAARFTRLRDSQRGEWDCAALGLPADETRSAASWGALIYDMGGMSASRWLGMIPHTAHVRDALGALGALSALSPQAFGGPPSRQSGMLSAFGGLALLIGWLFDRDPRKRQAMWSEWHAWRRVKPATTGDDLLARGIPRGPLYGRVLSRLRAAWLDGEIASPAEERTLLDTLVGDRG